MKPIRVLFTCIHNSARSQMAEEYLRKFSEGRIDVTSAGLEPGSLNPDVVRVLAEDGIDISSKSTQSVFALSEAGESFDYVVAVCDKQAAERCPIFPAEKKRLHWPFEDPSSIGGESEERLEKVRSIRDSIRDKVLQFYQNELLGS